jgi:hypothetical protein
MAATMTRPQLAPQEESLDVRVIASARQTVLTIGCAADRFEQAAIEARLRQACDIATAFVANPDARLGELIEAAAAAGGRS